MKDYSLIIFDADGTLTPFRDGELGPFSFTLLPGVKEKCAELRHFGVTLAIASNQGRRRPEEDIRAQMAWTAAQLGTVREMWVTLKAHQKPHPYMLLELIQYYYLDAADVLFVGGQPTDEAAARAAGVDFAWAADFFKQP